ncbi:DNA repair protein RadA [Acetohalobium arabaticum]|uniref:DNA repair protein RadA n=1 Tax=Acetohalobium arabaticum (strain ATCC 49924 / DSM 5501 / Z-7288) TaxID=574087 RepID=D9QSZ5_ACEAZ|nr:DNA repair protein RadA [Acetohalobium arabaticum]ADL11683.1 DNA repair protein RadA [Acetohalobium arabaticum DSM 5501]
MAKKKVRYVCEECGHEALKWNGQCAGCGSWNTLVKKIHDKQEKKKQEEKKKKAEKGNPPQQIDQITTATANRLKTELSELNRVLGGGIVPGSLILIGGAPGIGKSTLLLQLAYQISCKYGKVLYVSAEESKHQVKLRADRLQVNSSELYVLTETNYFTIEEEVKNLAPELVIIDSIQTIYDPDYDSVPGSIKQVRECTGKLMRLAKTEDIPIFLVGHVTKKGSIAGPKMLEHMVDVVLYFDSEQQQLYRILRSAKNRYGSTDEIGIFEMKQQGLIEVLNPSRHFISERPSGVSGSVIVPCLEGTRPILVEVQALTSTANYGSPTRMTSGVDHRRVSLILAVLEKRLGLYLQGEDVNINIAGGMQIEEPGIDLGIAVAIISSFRELPLPEDLLVLGEIGLSGEVRAVSRMESRIQEAIKLGFKQFIIPDGNLSSLELDVSDLEIEVCGVKQVSEVLDLILGGE